MSGFGTVRNRATALATLAAGMVLLVVSFAWLGATSGNGAESPDDAATARVLIYAGVPLTLVLLAIAVWLTLGAVMRRLDSMAATIDLIDGNQLEHRVLQAAGNDEVGRLAESLNAMLERIETATQRQRSLVADASHDLQSPLTGLRAELEVALAAPERVEVQTWARRLLAASTDMELLVSDLHLLAVAEDSRAPLCLEPVDLAKIALSEVEKASHGTGPTIEIEATSGITLYGDPSLLRRMIRNLLDNAMRHAQSAVELGVWAEADGIVLDVVDDGPGVGEVDRTRVFERFYRGDSTPSSASRPQGGSGLGLAIVRHVAELHGGTAILIPDEGAHFRVRLPIQA